MHSVTPVRVARWSDLGLLPWIVSLRINPLLPLPAHLIGAHTEPPEFVSEDLLPTRVQKSTFPVLQEVFVPPHSSIPAQDTGPAPPEDIAFL